MLGAASAATVSAEVRTKARRETGDCGVLSGVTRSLQSALMGEMPEMIQPPLLDQPDFSTASTATTDMMHSERLCEVR